MACDKELLTAATQAIEHATDGDIHTVGAAIRDGAGKIHTGVNLFHFVGGPCAEMTALANAAPETPVQIVAVAHERGVLSPCGRCRQILLDYAPGVEVMMPDSSVVPIEALLPAAYRWGEGLDPDI